MRFIETPIKDLLIFEPKIYNDSRGYFFESYNKEVFAEVGISRPFVQDNQSSSSFGTLRGLHMQVGSAAQAKLVRVLQGRVLDVAVDLRIDSSTYGKHFSIELSSENQKQLYIPRGFAHGFVVLSEVANFFYKCDNLYVKEAEVGVIYSDPTFSIDWILPEEKLLLSDKDKMLPSFEEAKKLI